jgi:sterol desaturase/sphingolipid hydroxylase (fatty acid hydroxylase superfamily)
MYAGISEVGMSGVYIAAAIPVFFTMIVAEYFVAARQGKDVYRFNDALTDLSCGIGQQMTQIVWAAAALAVYNVTYESMALFDLDSAALITWVFGVLAYDHQYYWWHRTTHRSKAFWTTHVVHHQSEDYNLAVALRQAWFSKWSSLLFYLPLAVLGLPTFVFAICSVTNTLYQFWIHTETIGKLGRWEWVLNTPSHHRVHHAVNPHYVDKNYAGFLIIWDRAYGTFAEEDVGPTYGTVKAHKSWNPVWANIGPIVQLVQETRAIQDPQAQLRYVFGPPEWRPESMGGPIEIPEPEPGRTTWDAQSVPKVHAYIAIHFIVLSTFVVWALATSSDWGLPVRLAVAASVIWTTTQWGGLLERRAWGWTGELVRLGALALGALLMWQTGMVSVTLVGATWSLVLPSLFWLTGPGRPPVRPAPVSA